MGTEQHRAGITPTIHQKGEASRLDAVLELVAFSARPCPLITSLDELPRRIAGVFKADVCSVYLLEGDDLVMRGNVGFPSDALGEVRLAVGEGITGLAVECMRPMSIDAAPAHESFKEFAVLDEARFPIFLAVPLAGPTGPLGALVLQRRSGAAFGAHEIELAAACTVPIAAAIERARMVDAMRGQKRAAGGGTRRVTLAGRSAHADRAVGSVCAFRRPAARPAPEPPRTPQEQKKALDTALANVRSTIDTLEARAKEISLETGFLTTARTILDDARLRERALELAREGQGLAQALGTVGAEAARTAARSGDPYGVDRAREIADVCEALAMLSAGDRRAEVPRGAVLTGNAVTLFDLLVSARSHPAAVVLSEPASGSAARALLALLGVPAVSDVAGLFRWISDGDIVLVDGDHGLVRLNPSRAEVASVRVEKKKGHG